MTKTPASKDSAAKIGRRAPEGQAQPEPIEFVFPTCFADFSVLFCRLTGEGNVLHFERAEDCAGSSPSWHLALRVA